MPRLAPIWTFSLLLCTARHSVATGLDDLGPLTGSHDSVLFSSTFPPLPSSGSGDGLTAISSSGNTMPNGFSNDQGDERALDLLTNGNRNPGPEPFVLSESNDCRLDVNQVPHKHRRRIRRGEGKACLLNIPMTSHGNENSSKDPDTSTYSEGSQDTSGEAGAEGQAPDKESATPQSPPAADPFWCPYFDRPIPVCGSYLWARNAIPPYTLPSCTPINPLLEPPCTSPMFLFCCQLVEVVRVGVLETKVVWRMSGRTWGLSARNCILPGASQGWLDNIRLPPPGF